MKIYKNLNYSRLLTISLLAICISCTNTKKEVEIKTNDLLSNTSYATFTHLNILEKSTLLEFITPATGCSNCIKEVEKFVIKSEGSLISSVITNIKSSKELRLSFDSLFLSKSKLDSSNYYVELIHSNPLSPWLFIYDEDSLLEKVPLTSDRISDILEVCMLKSVVVSKEQSTKK